MSSKRSHGRRSRIKGYERLSNLNSPTDQPDATNDTSESSVSAASWIPSASEQRSVSSQKSRSSSQSAKFVRPSQSRSSVVTTSRSISGGPFEDQFPAAKYWAPPVMCPRPRRPSRSVHKQEDSSFKVPSCHGLTTSASADGMESDLSRSFSSLTMSSDQEPEPSSAASDASETSYRQERPINNTPFPDKYLIQPEYPADLRRATIPTDNTSISKRQETRGRESSSIVFPRDEMLESVFLGPLKSRQVREKLRPGIFFLFYRLPKRRTEISLKLQLYVAYMSTHGKVYHFPLIREQLKNGLYWRVLCGERVAACFSSLSALVKYHQIYSYMDPTTQEHESFPIFDTTSSVYSDTEATVYENFK